ncbi:Mut7-C RNAse domain-containing protein [bacterium]|nr:Mut7-C RNAse domain-containing protein [bacterium]
MKFLVDFMLGRLNRWLRIMGYDCLYFRRDPFSGFKGKKDLIYQSLKEGRIILSRDTTLSKKKALKLIIIKSDFLSEQLNQVFKIFNLKLDKSKVFSRCIICNTLLTIIDKQKIRDKVPEYVYQTQNSFSLCLFCQKVYWKGTHEKLVEKELKKMLSL